MAAAKRRSTIRYQTKQGRYGTLYRFRIVYRDQHDPASPDFDWYTWAYDPNHAEDNFLDSDDEGWRILSINRVRE